MKRDTIKKAVGELAIIVAGILIALWADGMVSQQQARRVEAKRIEALRSNISDSLSELSEARNVASDKVEVLRTIASIEPGSPWPADSLFISGFMYGTAGFYPELNVYEDLKSSGELALLTNVKLRQALASMDAIIESVELHQADLLEVQQLNYDPFVIEELDLAHLIGSKLSVNVDRVSTRRFTDFLRIRNLATFKLNLVTDLIGLYDSAEASFNEVLASMESAVD